MRSVGETLHVWALVFTAIGVGCVAADRRGVRVPELAASVLMLLAMADVVFGRMLVSLGWVVILVAGAMILAMARRLPRSRTRDAAQSRMTVHTALGMIAMAILLLTMGHAGTPAPTHTHGASTHGASDGGVIIVLLCAAVASASAAAASALRAQGWLPRTQYAAMAASTLAMCLAAIV